MPKGIFSADPPQHTNIRAAMERLFMSAIDGIADVVNSEARTLLREAKVSARFDLYSAYALALPPRVLFTVLGLPPADWGGIEQWVAAIVAGNDPTQSIAVQAGAGPCAFALLAYYQALMAQCPHLGDPSKLTATSTQAAASNPHFSMDQALASLQNVTVAGYLSTTLLLATGVYELLRDASALADLRANMDLLRLNAPVQLVDRVAAKTTVLGGVTIPKGAKVVGVIGSANRDTPVFSDPDKLDIRRDNTRQFAFGGADHECLGEPLIKMVAPIGLRTLLNELPFMRLAGISHGHIAMANLSIFALGQQSADCNGA